MLGKVFKIELEDEDWSGSVSLRILPYNERMNFAKLSSENDGDDYDQAVKLNQLLKENIDSLDVKHVKGMEFKSVDDLEYYEEGALLMSKMIPLLIKGAPLGNVLKLT